MPVCPIIFRAACGGFLAGTDKHVLVFRLSHVKTVKRHSLRLSFARAYFNRHTATQIRRNGSEPWTTKVEWKIRQARLQANNCSLSVDNIDRTSMQNKEDEHELSLFDVKRMLTDIKRAIKDRTR